MASKTSDLAWLIQVEEEHETRFIRAHVVIPQENGELHSTSRGYGIGRPGNELADFRVSAYVGNFTVSTTGATGGDIWGLGHEFAPYRVENGNHAKDMVSVFGKVARGLAKAETESGYVRDGDFHAYFLRIAAALGIRTFYVRNGKRQRDMSGETYRKVNAATLQWWVGDVSETAANNPSDLIAR